MNGLPFFDVPTLGLDPADNTGWSYGCGDLLEYGVWHVKGSGSEHAGARLVRLEKRILEAHERFGIQRIAFENASLGSHHENTKTYHNRVSGVIIATAAKIGASWAQYAPTSIKAHAGHGHYDKPQMMAALARHYDIHVRTGDEADAIWVLLLDQHERSHPVSTDPPKPKSKTRRKVGGRRKKPKDPLLF